MKGLIFTLFAVVVTAQVPTSSTPVVAAGLIYQAAVQNGVAYVQPSAGQAIINTKAFLNWRNLIIQGVGVASMGAITAGVSNLMHMSMPVLGGLAVGHTVYDAYGQPLLQAGAPNPNNVAPVLRMTDSMGPSATSCAENSMYATSVSGITAPTAMKAVKKAGAVGAPRAVGPIMIGGLLVTYTPQGVGVLKNISGGDIKQFMVLDVLGCLPAMGVSFAPSTFPSHANIRINPDGIEGIRDTELVKAVPVSASRASVHVDPDAIPVQREPVAEPTVIQPWEPSIQQVSVAGPASVPLPVVNVVDNQIHDMLAVTRALPVTHIYPGLNMATSEYIQPVSLHSIPLLPRLPEVGKAVVRSNRTTEAEAHNQRGRELLYAGRYNDALVELDKAVRIRPAFAEAHNARGFTLHLMGDERGALEAYNRAIAIDPAYRNARANRELTMRALGQTKRAQL